MPWKSVTEVCHSLVSATLSSMCGGINSFESLIAITSKKAQKFLVYTAYFPSFLEEMKLDLALSLLNIKAM